MTLAIKIEEAENQAKNIGYYAYSAIQKHFKKTLKWETEVKKDKDPEALHQMRVGIRRLRTAITRFDQSVDLPKVVSDQKVGKIARCLGSLRDLDVLKETLEQLSKSDLPKKEQQSLRTAFDTLAKQREDTLENVRTTLKGERYKSIKEALGEWLEKPTYQPLACLPMSVALPDLLLPEVSRFLLHPGWLVGVQVQDSGVIIPRDWEAQKIEKELATNGKTLHSLRKQAKRLRYQMELFDELYGESYANYVAEIKKIQDVLGTIQDNMVLSEWLVNVFHSELQSQFPTLANVLAENRYQMWQQWQPLQERFLQAEVKKELHLTILHPLGKD